jgi:hypothetical protein
MGDDDGIDPRRRTVLVAIATKAPGRASMSSTPDRTPTLEET